MKKIIAELSREAVANVAGGATLSEKLVKVRDWDATVIEGCCSQGCCPEPKDDDSDNGWE
ncbi:hypothetical protein CR152_19265 [Massilia violaceinigra]|uniref:Uncharacterized protein n=1 Tax=Massilia violaceinigra TaxID=2045208 RepID=A0A2D2DN64_9BURK|nr:hypothetical protein [Massilia violaceinigra]ATQ76429.1 hypothetical protein CR152_19265 [Massilia violaceinigra]